MADPQRAQNIGSTSRRFILLFSFFPPQTGSPALPALQIPLLHRQPLHLPRFRSPCACACFDTHCFAGSSADAS